MSLHEEGMVLAGRGELLWLVVKCEVYFDMDDSDSGTLLLASTARAEYQYHHSSS